MSDYRIEFINSQSALERLILVLNQTKIVALDLETIEWWDKRREKVALIQIAFRANGSIKVVVIDALAKLNLEIIRPVLESKEITKVIHNAAFDATKLFRHYGFSVEPIHDTMVAARRNGERKYSLAAQSAEHLKIHLDKKIQQSDWSRRPLDIKQLDYAARDAYATLLLYEHQRNRNLTGIYVSRSVSDARQGSLLAADLESLPPSINKEITQVGVSGVETSSDELSAIEKVLLEVIKKLPDRFGPEQLAVSVGAEVRVGVAGWVIDSAIGKDSDIDEETAKLAIGNLCERKLMILTPARRLRINDSSTEVSESE